jgi:hypothetical protein
MKTESERTPLLDSNSENNLTKKQNKVFTLLKMAANHYRLLLAITCSTSFEVYLNMIKEMRQQLLPIPEHRALYDEYKKKLCNTAKGMNQIGDAEVEADKLEDAEVEADESGDAEVEADESEDAEVEADEFDDDGSPNGVS